MPAPIPVTTPAELIDAIEDGEILHVPPGVGSERVIEDPMHTDDGTEIAEGDPSTVTVLVVAQPDEVRVNVTLAVPGATPDTTPAELIVATDVGEHTQVPAPEASDNVVVVAVQRMLAPVIATGAVFTTKEEVLTTTPQPLEL